MKIRSFYEKLWGNHSLLTITIAAIVLRALFIPVQSGDYVEYLHPWFLELQQNGGLSSIGRPVGNYMVSYIYILALLTHLPVPDLISIKAVSFLGDIFLAMYVKKLAFAVWKDEKMSNILYTMILFLPTVFLNSAAWAQCDGIYTAALIACLYYLQKECPHQAMIAFSVAFVFKLQAVFLAPFLLAVFLQKRIRIRHCFLVPMLTMRLFSEERRQKTEQALFTAPVSFTGVVMGKFLACLTMYLLGMGVTLLYFLVMCAFQIPDVAVFCGNFLGLFLLGAALCAIGIFISSLTESQVIAAVGSLAIGLFLLFANSFTPVVSSEWINAVMDGISFYQHYLDFTRGLLNLSDLTFFVSVTALFLFLTVRHLERRRIS